MQIGLVRSVPMPATRRASSPTPSEPAPPTDAVELSSGSPRVLFSEAARLNLLPSSAAVPGPLGAVLSQAAQNDLGLMQVKQGEAQYVFAHRPHCVGEQ